MSGNEISAASALSTFGAKVAALWYNSEDTRDGLLTKTELNQCVNLAKKEMAQLEGLDRAAFLEGAIDKIHQLKQPWSFNSISHHQQPKKTHAESERFELLEKISDAYLETLSCGCPTTFGALTGALWYNGDQGEYRQPFTPAEMQRCEAFIQNVLDKTEGSPKDAILSFAIDKVDGLKRQMSYRSREHHPAPMSRGEKQQFELKQKIADYYLAGQK